MKTLNPSPPSERFGAVKSIEDIRVGHIIKWGWVVFASVFVWFCHWMGLMGVEIASAEMFNIHPHIIPSVPKLNNIALAFLTAMPSAVISVLPAAAVWKWTSGH